MDKRIENILISIIVIAVGFGSAYLTDPNGGAYYMVRGYVSNVESIGMSGLIGLIGVGGLILNLYRLIVD